MRINVLGNGFAAEISGVDVNRISAREFDAMRQAFLDHSVIFIRDQHMSCDEHIAFAERWGEINVNRFFAHVAGQPRIAEVRKEADQTANIGGG